MVADLHLHTTASDGTWLPGELPKKARDLSIRIIAITDHDTVYGVKEALANTPNGITIIPGIELSTNYQGAEVHLLGYWIDTHNRTLTKTLVELRADRHNRAKNIIANLDDQEIHIHYEDVKALAGQGSLGRLHIAKALIDAGYVKSIQEAFLRFIGPTGSAYEPRTQLSTEQAIGLVLEAGGVPVLAHPGVIGLNDSAIPKLKALGLQGLEVKHPNHTFLQEAHYLSLCKKFALAPTGGSDCHGPGGKEILHIGTVTIPERWVYQLKARMLYP